jgi:hypothetical protein
MTVLQADLRLQAVVDGIACIGVLDDAAVIAIRVADGISEEIVSGGARLRGIGARGHTRRNEVLEAVVNQRSDIGIAIDLLEIGDVVIADIANFRGYLCY